MRHHNEFRKEEKKKSGLKPQTKTGHSDPICERVPNKKREKKKHKNKRTGMGFEERKSLLHFPTTAA